MPNPNCKQPHDDASAVDQFDIDRQVIRKVCKVCGDKISEKKVGFKPETK